MHYDGSSITTAVDRRLGNRLHKTRSQKIEVAALVGLIDVP